MENLKQIDQDFIKKVQVFLLNKIDIPLKIVNNDSLQILVLENKDKKSFYHIFSPSEEKIILTKNFPDGKEGYISKEKRTWTNFEQFSADIHHVCKILGCKKITK